MFSESTPNNTLTADEHIYLGGEQLKQMYALQNQSANAGPEIVKTQLHYSAENAFGHFSAAIALQTTNYLAYHGIAAIILTNIPDSPPLEEKTPLVMQAVGFLDRAIALNPQIAANYELKGEALSGLGNPELGIVALACYRTALTLNPDNLQILMSMGSLLENLRQDDEAVKCYSHVLGLYPRNIDAHTYKANILQYSNRIPEALDAYRAALEVFGCDNNEHATYFYKKKWSLLKETGQHKEIYDDCAFLQWMTARGQALFPTLDTLVKEVTQEQIRYTTPQSQLTPSGQQNGEGISVISAGLGQLSLSAGKGHY